MEPQVLQVLRDLHDQIQAVRMDALFARDWDREISESAAAQMLIALAHLEQAANHIKLARLAGVK